MNSSNSVVIVTPSTPNHTASAQIGQTVEVQLPTSDRWAYEASASAPAGLSLAQPAGIEDGQLDLCIWNFSARSAGTATLSFSGAPICDPKVPCPAYAVAQNFIIRVG